MSDKLISWQLPGCKGLFYGHRTSGGSPSRRSLETRSGRSSPSLRAQGLAVSFLDSDDEPGGATPAASAGRARSRTYFQTPTPIAHGDAAILAQVRKRADVKDPVATEYLGQLYYHGKHGLQPDIPRAIELWTEAARLGDLDAHFKIGRLYFKGEGVEQDVARGIRHWQHAAIQGQPGSRLILGLHEWTDENHELAVQHLMLSAKMGDADSLNSIKKMFMEGHATKAQYAEALKGYQTALEETKSPQREEAKAFLNGNSQESPGTDPLELNCPMWRRLYISPVTRWDCHKYCHPPDEVEKSSSSELKFSPRAGLERPGQFPPAVDGCSPPKGRALPRRGKIAGRGAVLSGRHSPRAPHLPRRGGVHVRLSPLRFNRSSALPPDPFSSNSEDKTGHVVARLLPWTRLLWGREPPSRLARTPAAASRDSSTGKRVSGRMGEGAGPRRVSRLGAPSRKTDSGAVTGECLQVGKRAEAAPPRSEPAPSPQVLPSCAEGQRHSGRQRGDVGDARASTTIGTQGDALPRAARWWRPRSEPDPSFAAFTPRAVWSWRTRLHGRNPASSDSKAAQQSKSHSGPAAPGSGPSASQLSTTPTLRQRSSSAGEDDRMAPPQTPRPPSSSSSRGGQDGQDAPADEGHLGSLGTWGPWVQARTDAEEGRLDVKAASTRRILLDSGDDMSLAEKHQPPAPAVPAAGPIPDAVTEEELMSSGHELPEGNTCPLCCLPIALPMTKSSSLQTCCMKMVCHGCNLASVQRGLKDICPFCRTPNPDGDAAILALVRKRVDARDPVATEFLASAYHRGNRGLQQDIPRSIELWTEAANLGDLNAHFNLGYRYWSGKGVEQDVARGIRHLQHAAMQGHPGSRFMLGFHEYKSRNDELAVQHWMISAKMGHEVSPNEIKEMFMKGHATKAQYAEALRGYQNALDETKSPQREEAKAFFNERSA
ncbi:hypothetical protein THAOC_05789 [Thalassiosira oceanica]|uniref:RING-type domain-containing protein n=1 Tax=Thalassiosira oceanica TaxID=159749 RepID=K0T6I7_THAOC|nr:hypothetical protein THAOC_05789 [Thalassiosira oceanica]|eukprot:EJK72659.1 hypothetical protein THAOC_05789 [Thalassiosira oceanica]